MRNLHSPGEKGSTVQAVITVPRQQYRPMCCRPAGGYSTWPAVERSLAQPYRRTARLQVTRRMSVSTLCHMREGRQVPTWKEGVPMPTPLPWEWECGAGTPASRVSGDQPRPGAPAVAPASLKACYIPDSQAAVPRGELLQLPLLSDSQLSTGELKDQKRRGHRPTYASHPATICSMLHTMRHTEGRASPHHHGRHRMPTGCRRWRQAQMPPPTAPAGCCCWPWWGTSGEPPPLSSCMRQEYATQQEVKCVDENDTQLCFPNVMWPCQRSVAMASQLAQNILLLTAPALHPTIHPSQSADHLVGAEGSVR